MVDDEEIVELVEMELRELLSFYKYAKILKYPRNPTGNLTEILPF